MGNWTPLVNTLNAVVLNTFGRDVVYIPQAFEPVTLRAIFEPTREPEQNSPGVYAVLFARVADLPQPPERGDEVTVDGAAYKVFDIEADTTGAVVLRLRQA